MRPEPAPDRPAADTSRRPLVLLCTGAECGRRWERDQSGLRRLRECIRSTHGGILVTTGCLDRCAAGAVAVVGWQVGPGLTMAGALVLAGVQDDATAASVTGWIVTHAEAPGRHPLETLPLALRSHLIQ